ncbi:FCS-Like Zinc finger 8-like [Cucumis melo]|uniref:FCS-Like Zinc finger 8-like n=1 Tax=Cucumis melo TaxID=3656 RepID=A0A1S3CPR3_CUCME|nr:FCS-Like Zinc finger 8-like [Cucumis melo]
MLRNRSRAVSGKQALMADSQISRFSSYSYTKPLENSLFGSPKYKAFSPTKQAIDDHTSVISPTSVLDSNNKSFFSLQNPFIKLPNPKVIAKTTKISQEIISGPKKPIGLALIEDKNDDSKPTKSVIFSAKLRLQIPPPDSTVDGGGNHNNNNNDNIGTLMTVKEMEVCEEYTCVKRHGPNAKITHIFDNFVVKTLVDDYCHYGSSCNFSMADRRKKKKMNNNDFLRFCYTCKNDLQLTNDIYIYRGEKGFCSHECRNQEMLLDEEDEDSS